MNKFFAIFNSICGMASLVGLVLAVVKADVLYMVFFAVMTLLNFFFVCHWTYDEE